MQQLDENLLIFDIYLLTNVVLLFEKLFAILLFFSILFLQCYSFFFAIAIFLFVSYIHSNITYSFFVHCITIISHWHILQICNVFVSSHCQQINIIRMLYIVSCTFSYKDNKLSTFCTFFVSSSYISYIHLYLYDTRGKTNNKAFVHYCDIHTKCMMLLKSFILRQL